MAPDASLVAAGGTDDGRIGTSFDLVSAGIAEADSGVGVVVLCDLGSAILTAETALDFLDDDIRARVRIVDAPIVEGGVAAAVAAESGDPLDDVIAAAESARGGPAAADARRRARAGGAGSQVGADRAAGSSGHSRTVTLVNADGLHARPAAELVKLAGDVPAARDRERGRREEPARHHGARADEGGAGRDRDRAIPMARPLSTRSPSSRRRGSARG